MIYRLPSTTHRRCARLVHLPVVLLLLLLLMVNGARRRRHEQTSTVRTARRVCGRAAAAADCRVAGGAAQRAVVIARRYVGCGVIICVFVCVCVNTQCRWRVYVLLHVKYTPASRDKFKFKVVRICALRHVLY